MGLWNSLSGYVMIQIEEICPEAFLNKALGEKIRLYAVKRSSARGLSAVLSMEDFYCLRRLPPELRGRIRIRKKGGLPLLLLRLRFHKALLLGGCLALFGLFLLSRFLWFIEIQGAGEGEEAAIRSYLSQQGVRPGIKRRTLDLPGLQKALSQLDADIAWAGLELQGVRLRISLAAAKNLSAPGEAEGPCHIAAKKDARIRSVVTKKGRQMTEAGRAVKEGEILISGILEREGFDTLFVQAEGTILGELAYTFTSTLGPKFTAYAPGERECLYTALSLFGREYTAFQSPYEVFETRLLEARGPWGNVLPLVFRRYACRELCLMEQSLETEGVLEEAILQAEKKALSAIPPGARILSKESRMTPLENGAVRLELIYITEEEIGVSLPIQQE